MTEPRSTVEHLPARPADSRRTLLLRVLAAALVLPACAWGAWQGGSIAIAAVMVAALLPVGRAGGRRASNEDPTIAPAARPAAASAATPGTEVAPADRTRPRSAVHPMISKVIPVWVRQLETTRSTADTGLTQVLQSFTEITGSLDALLGSLEGMASSAQPGALDQAVSDSAGPLASLLAPSTRAQAQRDRAIAELNHCSGQLTELALLARQAREIGRHTRLVAFNASIEASREQHRQDGGNETVAHEMRLIATRMSDNAARTHKLLVQLQQRLDPMRHEAVTQESTAEELRMELELRAREALQALMASVGASLSTSGSVREASAALRQHLDDAFVHFQFGDRLSQMLAIVGNDMNNFVEWTSRHPDATFDDASEWLKRLEASYTMEEQRSEHHGNVHVDRGSEVEFF